MKRSSGARLGATAAMSVLSLALITGCSDEGSGDAEGAGKGPQSSASSASPTGPAAKALGPAELKKLLVAQGDVKGYKVEATDESFPRSKSAVKVDKAPCRPLAYAMAGLAPGDTDASVSSTATEDKKPTSTATSLEDVSEDDFANAFDVTVTVVGLSSYDGDGAEKAFRSVSDAVASCSGGFTIAAQGEDQKLTKVAAEKGSGTGDESVAFAASGKVDGGETGDVHTEVVRHGNTIATYYTVSFMKLTSGGAYTVPAVVVDAQAAKLK
ncbi:hypothetical protein ACFV0T_11805 [Streptomyces sp. NPDC059582]|uniref:hypothetical protein n=1 Tax=Streptomyces sp. NPDC059582 TaxID=3346875 RepID=UPI00368328ED